MPEDNQKTVIELVRKAEESLWNGIKDVESEVKGLQSRVYGNGKDGLATDVALSKQSLVRIERDIESNKESFHGHLIRIEEEFKKSDTRILSRIENIATAKSRKDWAVILLLSGIVVNLLVMIVR